MGYIAGLVPGTKAASTCQVNAQGTRSPHPRCGSGPIISITSEEDRRLSLGLRRKESSEPRVNFSLPPKASTSQTSSREKIRGSPRFPHRIVPTNSLNAIAAGSSISKSHQWHSMEDPRKSKAPQLPRGSSCSPTCDVWATRELGIPLSELGNSARCKKPPESLMLTVMAESNVNSDGLKRPIGESCDVSPAESELKVTRSISSSPTSPTNTRTSSATNDASRSDMEQASTNFVLEPDCSRNSSPINAEETADRTNALREDGKLTAA